MSFFSKFLKGLGFEEEEESVKQQKPKEKKKNENKSVLASYDLKKSDESTNNKTQSINTKNESVVNINQINEERPNTQFEIVNVSSQIEVQDVIKRIKNNEKILINMSSLSNEDKNRSLDFLSGAVFALGLSMQKVDGSVYLIQ